MISSGCACSVLAQRSASHSQLTCLSTELVTFVAILLPSSLLHVTAPTMCAVHFASLFLVNFLFFVGRVAGQNGPTTWSTTPFNPSALPLAVRSPYLNTWLPQGNNPAAVNNQWSTIWTTSNVRPGTDSEISAFDTHGPHRSPAGMPPSLSMDWRFVYLARPLFRMLPSQTRLPQNSPQLAHPSSCKPGPSRSTQRSSVLLR